MSGAVPKIRLRGLSKAFGPKQVLDGVDLDIRATHRAKNISVMM